MNNVSAMLSFYISVCSWIQWWIQCSHLGPASPSSSKALLIGLEESLPAHGSRKSGEWAKRRDERRVWGLKYQDVQRCLGWIASTVLCWLCNTLSSDICNRAKQLVNMTDIYEQQYSKHWTQKRSGIFILSIYETQKANEYHKLSGLSKSKQWESP